MAKVGFLGLGRMGFPMARNLAAAGHDVHVYDPSEEVGRKAAEAGLKTASRVDAAVEGADFVISMVPTGRHVLEIFLGDDGVLAKMAKGSMAIDSSTIDTADARRLHAAGRERGIAVLDAPVSGGVMGAEAGTLTFMVGGSAEDLERARPVLEAMGRRIFHAGEPGVGQAAKLCNNLLAGISMIAVSEAFALARHLGLDARKMQEISAVSTGGCFSLTNYPPVPGLVPNVPSSREYRNGFASQLMLKDLKLAQQAAIQSGTALPLGGLAAALYGVFCQAGHSELDYSAIIKLIEGDNVRTSDA
ncbi:3-hydroxyisobutyrate dehydrogenase [Roseixanthobacter pseudopolyaromaticivorans]|uniref:3-hydroxyisobutyrate dehydrogenase n=1 Tax=Xanthobacteraceae TaxID=335928 RepID=UPI00372872F7